MNVGFVGLGKLGLPCAVAAAQAGHVVYGFDPSPTVQKALEAGEPSRYIKDEPEIDLQYAYHSSNIRVCRLVDDVVERCDLVLLSPQTPHPPELDGSVRFNHARKDFDYTFLKDCVRQTAQAYARLATPARHFTMVIVSTVLPTTTRQVLEPIFRGCLGAALGERAHLLYSPSFIAQSTVVSDYRAPEFALIGVKDHMTPNHGVELYKHYLSSIHDAPKLVMEWESAELAKVCYNTFIGAKIVLANTVLEICDRLGHGDAHTVMRTLQLATDRIVSPKYMLPGMGDGGGCHPRDNIAMSFLSEKLGLKYNIFDYIMTMREEQTMYLAKLAVKARTDLKLEGPIWIFGKAFKPGVSQTTGSPSVLLGNMLLELGEEVVMWDPATCDEPELPTEPVVAVLANPEYQMAALNLPPGSFIVNPWAGTVAGELQ